MKPMGVGPLCGEVDVVIRKIEEISLWAIQIFCIVYFYQIHSGNFAKGVEVATIGFLSMQVRKARFEDK